MKFIVVCAMIAITMAQTPVPLPIERSGLGHYPYPYHTAAIPILRQTQDIDPATGYQWSFSSANGINAEESATIIPLGPELADKQVRGAYDYISPEGIPVRVEYYSDLTGFHPKVSVHVGQPGVPRFA
ncbi:hypothetical protein FQA39_LY13751 [Lamprigera yunnana]|nr:hypothetical protein FQA39_LY13751 [Lamprigera yunnana]